MLPEGLRRQPKARSPASLRQGASQTFFQQIYAFTEDRFAHVVITDEDVDQIEVVGDLIRRVKNVD